MNRVPTVPAFLFGAVTTVLESKGVSCERILVNESLPHWQHYDPTLRVPGSHFFRLFARAASEAGEEHLGALVAEDMLLTSLGPVGDALEKSLTVCDSIRAVAELTPRFQDTASFHVVQNDAGLWWFRRRVQTGDHGCRQVEINTLRLMIGVVQAGAGLDWRPSMISLEFDPVPGFERLEIFRGTEVLCGREMTGLAIPKSLLPRRIPDRRCWLPASAGDGVSAAAPANDSLGSLRQIVHSFLALGHPPIEMIAEAADLSVRTFQRRLAQEGLNFKTLVDQVRFEAATDLLEAPDVKLVEVAHDLGYADQAHFNRAFRRWAGVSPGEYRLQQLSI